MAEIKIYKILTGVTEDEYYTYSQPIFNTEDDSLDCSDVIMRRFIERLVINKQITVSYAENLTEKQIFLLADGVVIKTVLVSELDEWIDRNESEANEELKNKELELYREIIPRLVNNSNLNKTGTKNLLI